MNIYDLLPLKFKQDMKELLKDEYDDYISCLNEKIYHGIRINNLKISNKDFFYMTNLELESVPWTDNGFYISEDEKKISKSPLYYAGLFYFQEPSAMSSAGLCKIGSDERILDLCAAPGGKTTQISNKLGEKGFILSNDLSASRAKALLKNVELSGIKNIFISSESSDKLAKIYNNYFTTIIVDAPCSGEGMFRKDIDVLKAYIKRGPDAFPPIQSAILQDAANMLCEGGQIIYSTCTYSKKEDEDIINNFLDNNKNFHTDILDYHEGFYCSDFTPNAYRLFPHRLKGEGHFVVRLVKDGEYSYSSKRIMNNTEFKSNVDKKTFNLVMTTLSEFCTVDFDKDRLFLFKDYIYYLPEQFLYHSSIHYLRSGLLLGRIAYSRFEPSQAFIMSLKFEELIKPLNLDIADERLVRYLKGETITSDDKIKGYRVVCVNSYPLGLCKQSGELCKNKYYKGWRMQ